MEKGAKKIDKENILKLIKEEAEFILKKEEYYEKVKTLEVELKNLYENRDFVGTFGFEGDNASKSISGFENTPNISYIAQLEKEFSEKDKVDETIINEDELNEVEKLKEENNKLKTQLEEITAFISEMKKAGSNK
jgi:hypothetical protein